MNELIVLSDIHGNLSALRAVVKDFQTNYSPDALPVKDFAADKDL